MELITQPHQYNLTKYRPVDRVDDLKDGYEFGVNVGTLFRKHVYKDVLNVYVSLSIGPHYVSGTPERQANGFIFSDNLFTGLNIKVFNNFYLDLRAGFRHISNAELMSPNGGLNDIMVGGGILLNL